MARKVSRLSEKDAEIIRQSERAAEEQMRAMVRPPRAEVPKKIPDPPIQWIPWAEGKRIAPAARRRLAKARVAHDLNSVVAAYREVEVAAGITETEPRARVEAIHAAAIEKETDPAVRAEIENQLLEKRRRALEQANRLAAEYERSLGAPAERVDRMRKREAQEAALLARKKAGGAKGYALNRAAQETAKKNAAAVARAIRLGHTTIVGAAVHLGIDRKTVKKHWPKT